MFAPNAPDGPEARPSTPKRSRGRLRIVPGGPPSAAGDLLATQRGQRAIARDGFDLLQGQLSHSGNATPHPRNVAEEGAVIEARTKGKGSMRALDTDRRKFGLKLGHALPA